MDSKMKLALMKLIKDDNRVDQNMIIDSLIENVIEKFVIQVRNNYASQYNIDHGCFQNYRGLSYNMTLDLYKLITEYIARNDLRNILEFDIDIIEGYNKIYRNGYNKSVVFKHFWLEVNIFHKSIYVDASSQELRHIHKDIPDYYIDKKKPKWYFKIYKDKFIDNFIMYIWRPILNGFK